MLKSLLFSMEVSCCLNVDGRGFSLEGFFCGKVRFKWRRKSRSDRLVR